MFNTKQIHIKLLYFLVLQYKFVDKYKNTDI